MLDVLKEVRDNLEDVSDDDDDSQDKNNGAPYMGGDYVHGGPRDTEQRNSGIYPFIVSYIWNL